MIIKIQLSSSRIRCSSRLVFRATGNAFNTFGDVVTSDLAVLVGFVWDGDFGQVKNSLYLVNGGLHVGQPAEEQQ